MDDRKLETLLAAAAQGDRIAFKSLYDVTSARLFGLILLIVRDRPTAEEVLQEAFLNIWRNARGFSSREGRPYTWMAIIARNRAIDRRRRRTEVLLDPLPDGRDWLEAVAGPMDTTDVAELDRLRRCLSRMGAVHRDCIVLAYCEGYSRDELAARFAKPVNTIKTWLHRGVRHLRACMGGARQ